MYSHTSQYTINLVLQFRVNLIHRLDTLFTKNFYPGLLKNAK